MSQNDGEITSCAFVLLRFSTTTLQISHFPFTPTDPSVNLFLQFSSLRSFFVVAVIYSSVFFSFGTWPEEEEESERVRTQNSERNNSNGQTLLLPCAVERRRGGVGGGEEKKETGRRKDMSYKQNRKL